MAIIINILRMHNQAYKQYKDVFFNFVSSKEDFAITFLKKKIIISAIRNCFVFVSESY